MPNSYKVLIPHAIHAPQFQLQITAKLEAEKGTYISRPGPPLPGLVEAQ